MQNTNTNASILIWSIFLSLIISIIFINSSSKIGKIIQNNSLISESIDNNYQKKQILSEKKYRDSKLDTWEQIIFDNNISYTWTLKSKETSEIQFLDTNNTINVTIINGWPVFYSFSTDSSLSGTIIGSISIPSVQSWSLYIRNLWWYSKYNIQSDNDFLTKTKRYKIIKKIGNKEVIKSSSEIKNF